MDKDKKGYHLYLTMHVMKEFKKMCAESGSCVAREVEDLMIKKLKEYEDRNASTIRK